MSVLELNILKLDLAVVDIVQSCRLPPSRWEGQIDFQAGEEFEFDVQEGCTFSFHIYW